MVGILIKYFQKRLVIPKKILTLYCNQLLTLKNINHMKKLFVLFLFVSSTCFSQVKYPLKKFPIHSSIWNAEVYNQDPNLVFLSPKGETNFEYNSTYLKKMDMSIVRSYLKTSFDNFRLSYGYKVRPENKTLSVLCTEDAKKLTTNKGKYVNNDPKATQIDNFIPYFCFGNVDTKKMDINRVIADSFFDYCVGDDVLMDVLLDNGSKEYGFGISYNETSNGFIMVVKSKTRKGS